jgi:hypothetical protein
MIKYQEYESAHLFFSQFLNQNKKESCITYFEKIEKVEKEKINNASYFSSLLKITSKLASNAFLNGKVLAAAIYHLSINDIEGAILKLIRGDELEFAFILSKFFESKSNFYLVKKIILMSIGSRLFNSNNLELEEKENLRKNEWTLLFKKLIQKIPMKNNEEKLSLLGLIESIHRENISEEDQFKKLAEYEKFANEQKKAGESRNCILYYNLARNYEQCFIYANQYAKGNLYA